MFFAQLIRPSVQVAFVPYHPTFILKSTLVSNDSELLTEVFLCSCPISPFSQQPNAITQQMGLGFDMFLHIKTRVLHLSMSCSETSYAGIKLSVRLLDILAETKAATVLLTLIRCDTRMGEV